MALAYATDLATGHSRDFALRSCVLAMRFAEAAALDEPIRRAVYHQALLRYIGVTSESHKRRCWGASSAREASSMMANGRRSGRGAAQWHLRHHGDSQAYTN